MCSLPVGRGHCLQGLSWENFVYSCLAVLILSQRNISFDVVAKISNSLRFNFIPVCYLKQ